LFVSPSAARSLRTTENLRRLTHIPAVAIIFRVVILSGILCREGSLPWARLLP